jgi:AcrR family transcriptional regulator
VGSSTTRGRQLRAESKARTRRELLDAAARVFLRRGFFAASLDEIAEEAGYSKGAIYSNFSDKEELLLALIAERVELRRQRCVAVGAARVGCDAKTQAAAIEYVAMLDEQREWLALFLDFWTCAARNPELQHRFAEEYRRMKATIAELVDQELELSVPVDEVVTAMFAIGQGIALERVADPDGVPDGLLGHLLAAYLHRVGIPRSVPPDDAAASFSSVPSPQGDIGA